MTPEAQRIAIAEACGWSQPEEGYWKDPQGHEWQVMHGWQTYKDGSDILPDYLNDLNAMHEAEKVLTQAQKVQRVQNLCIICDRKYGGDIEPSDVLSPVEMTSMFLDCTAAQRAEAFLKTRGLWKEKV